MTQPGRTFDIRHNTADITLRARAARLRAAVSLEEGMAELIEWAKTSPDGAVDMFDRALSELQHKGLLVQSRHRS